MEILSVKIETQVSWLETRSSQLKGHAYITTYAIFCAITCAKASVIRKAPVIRNVSADHHLLNSGRLAA
jgi:hypothetical protein